MFSWEVNKFTCCWYSKGLLEKIGDEYIVLVNEFIEYSGLKIIIVIICLYLDLWDFKWDVFMVLIF